MCSMLQVVTGCDNSWRGALDDRLTLYLQRAKKSHLETKGPRGFTLPLPGGVVDHRFTHATTKVLENPLDPMKIFGQKLRGSRRGI